MKGGNGQEDEELEMLLGEIPNATSAANLHVEEFGVNSSSMSLVSASSTEKTMGKSFCSDSLNDYYLASQPSKPSSPSVSHSPVPAAICSSFPSFCNGLNLSSHSSINSPTKNIVNRKAHSEDNLVVANSPGRKEYPQPVESADGEDNCPSIESKLPDVQSLTSALSNLSFNSEMSIGPAMDASVQYQCSPNSGLLIGGQFPKHMARDESGFEEILGVFPQSPNTATCVHFGNTAVETQGIMSVRGGTFPSLLSTHAVDKFNGEVSGEVNSRFLKLNTHETERDKHNLRPRLPVDEFASTFGEQQQSLPMYSGPVQFSSGIHPFQVHPSVPVSGVEFPASVYQQQYYFNLHSSPFMQPQQYGHLNASIQQLNQCHMAWQHRDEESCKAAQQQFAYLQLQFQGIKNVSQLHPNSNGPSQSLNICSRQPYCEVPISHVEHHSLSSGLNDNMYPQRLSQSTPVLKNGCLSPYSDQSFFGKSENCLSEHGQNHTLGNGFISLSNSSSKEDFQGIKILERAAKQNFPERILTRSHGVNALRNLNTISYLPNEIAVSHANSNVRPLPDLHSHHHHLVPNAGSFTLEAHNSGGSSPDKSERLTPRSRQHLKCASLDEIEGRIYAFAKDQHGCRFLQEKFVEGTADDVQKIFSEIIVHIVELMTDPFGNYLVQKLLDVCNENQKIQILHAITGNAGVLVNICLNMHGTRAVQKVIETLKTSEQITMVVSSLRDGAVTLIKDLNGNHVVQRCLQCLENQHNEFLFDAAAAHCVEIATHRHGCCVLQKCLHHSEGERRQRLVSEVVMNALILSQDPFGNYVVQYVIELGLSWATTHVIDQLEGHFVNLSTQKYSSNVVEKCLKMSEDEKRALIIHELIDDPRLGQLLQDPFANYVVQSALANSKGPVHSAFVDAIKPHLPALRSNPYGKRILSCTNLKTQMIM
ncbi:uncharacterized protein LOC116248757 isoform X2 [Nymphaea colorata]|uniref:uncharacterized protein LOC116248757 isoform X2 n=1 Tax=Nymphaea colorata TaxID=210225 RepID=UPI00129EBA00|nr:uncharacterized protein LOC116248757 isoform X2 [Nymphaea colorata]